MSQQSRQGGGNRPGAMTMAMKAVNVNSSAPKVLRIGLIQNGRIVEERIIRKRETVSIGTSERNHFIIQAPGLDARFDLFQLVGNDYILNFKPSMKGRVGLPGGVQDLETLRSTNAARNAGEYWQVKLADSSRGKIVIGNVTLLFQFVVPPPVQPRPQLPAAARGGFVKGIDWVFTAFVVFMYMTVFGFIIYLENADWPIEQGVAVIPDSMARFILEEPAPPEPEEDAEATEEEATEEEAAEEAPEEAPTKQRNNNQPSDSRRNNNSSDSGAESAAESTARIQREASAQAEQLLLGALGQGGALADVLAGGASTSSAEDVMAQAGGVGVAMGRGGGNLRARGGGGGSGEGGGLGGLRRSQGGGMAVMASGMVIERVIRGGVRFERLEEEGGSGEFAQGQVVRKIKARSSAFKRCYETQLRQNPGLAGKVTVRFTIREAGNVSGARATGNTTNNAALASCVVGVLRRLRWSPGPEGGSVDFSYPFVFRPQN